MVSTIKKTILACGAVLGMAAFHQTAMAADSLIDDFANPTTVINRDSTVHGSPSPPISSAATAVTGGDHGGNRTLTIQIDSGTGIINAFVDGGQVYDYSSSSLVAGTGILDYDFGAGTDMRSLGQDALSLGVPKNDGEALQITIEVWDGDSSASDTQTAVEDQAGAGQTLFYDYTSFPGVDFTDVRDIQIRFTAPVDQDLLLDDLEAVDRRQPSVTVSKIATPGCLSDGTYRISYSITVQNSSGETATGLALTDAVDGNTTVVAGSATSTQGTVAEAPNSVGVPDIGTLLNGQSATITFQADVNAIVSPGTVIFNIASVTGDSGINVSSNETQVVVIECIDPTPAPTMGQWAMVLLTLSLLGLGMAGLRRRV